MCIYTYDWTFLEGSAAVRAECPTGSSFICYNNVYACTASHIHINVVRPALLARRPSGHRGIRLIASTNIWRIALRHGPARRLAGLGTPSHRCPTHARQHRPLRCLASPPMPNTGPREKKGKHTYILDWNSNTDFDVKMSGSNTLKDMRICRFLRAQRATLNLVCNCWSS